MPHSREPRLYLNICVDSCEELDPHTFAIARSEDEQPAAFTTFRTHQQEGPRPTPALLYFNQHLGRVVNDAVQLGLITAKAGAKLRSRLLEQVPGVLRKFIASHELLGAPVVVRIVIRYGGRSELFLERFANPWRSSGIRALRWEGARPRAGVKSSLVQVSLAAREHARRSGVDEALLVSDGVLREGAWSNVFWFDRKGTLCTPRTVLLPGITRAALLAAHSCRIEDTLYDRFLEEAVEVFVTQSTTGITPVTEIDGQKLDLGSRTAALADWYRLRIAADGEPLFAEELRA